MARNKTILVLSITSSLFAGCATQSQLPVDDLPPTAAGGPADHIIDSDSIGFYTEGNWTSSTSVSGYQGDHYLQSAPGSGNNVATWNLNIIRTFDVYAKWTSSGLRGSNVKYVVHYLDDRDNLVTETVTVDQRQNNGEWVKLGTYRMSTLTGRVTVSDDADGYVVADAVMFREIGIGDDQDDGDTPDTSDSDGDGIDDEWERQYGLNPDDPSDAGQDLDGDGLSNKDEFVFLTDPTIGDTDADGVPDGFEVAYGLDPTVDDSGLDSDADGLTNFQEYLADTDPNDDTSGLASNSVLLTWEAPTERANGSALSQSEIAEYELSYQQVSSSTDMTIDNTDSEFVSYGGGRESTGYGGFIGDNYFIMNPGSGEVSAQWQVYELSSGTEYELYGHWVSTPLRAPDAEYRYTYTSSNGSQTTEAVTVDQRENGGAWQLLGTFVSGGSQAVVEIDNDSDGYVIADAIRLTGSSATENTVSIEPGSHNSYILTDLKSGEWQFKIRAVDSDGLASEYSEIATRTIE